MINWKVRLKNKNFWVAIVPALLILVQVICELFNIKVETLGLNNKLLNVINAVFTVLVIVGVVNDPTTHGLGDSTQALNYIEPKKGE